MNPAHAIRPAAVSINGLDALAQRAIGACATAVWTLPPGIIAALADLQNTTHDLHLELRSMLLDEAESQLCSLLKKITAAFKMSRSCRATSSSRHSRLISASSSAWWPFPTKAAGPSPL